MKIKCVSKFYYLIFTVFFFTFSLSLNIWAQEAESLKPGASSPAHGAQPCAQDVKSLCPDVKPGEGRIGSCLKEHKDKIGETCKAHMKSRRENIKENCASDVKKFCADIKLGKKRVAQCLRKHKDSLSEKCMSSFPRMKKHMDNKKTSGE